MTVHSVDVDNDGLSMRWLDGQSEKQDLANVLALAAGYGTNTPLTVT
jgi:hypothetical protein